MKWHVKTIMPVKYHVINRNGFANKTGEHGKECSHVNTVRLHVLLQN